MPPGGSVTLRYNVHVFTHVGILLTLTDVVASHLTAALVVLSDIIEASQIQFQFQLN